MTIWLLVDTVSIRGLMPWDQNHHIMMKNRAQRGVVQVFWTISNTAQKMPMASVH